MIKDDELIYCGWCDKASTSKEWQEATYNACFTREQRRQFKPFNDEKMLKKNSKVYFLCPKCKMWAKGCQEKLVRVNEDGTEKVLGGTPVIKVLDSRKSLNDN